MGNIDGGCLSSDAKNLAYSTLYGIFGVVSHSEQEITIPVFAWAMWKAAPYAVKRNQGRDEVQEERGSADGRVNGLRSTQNQQASGQ